MSGFWDHQPRTYGPMRHVAKLKEEITYRLMCDNCGSWIDTLTGECSKCRTVNEILPQDAAIIREHSRR